jgi:hypothetical protein
MTWDAYVSALAARPGLSHFEAHRFALSARSSRPRPSHQTITLRGCGLVLGWEMAWVPLSGAPSPSSSREGSLADNLSLIFCPRSPDLPNSRFPKILLYRRRCRVSSELEAGATESARLAAGLALARRCLPQASPSAGLLFVVTVLRAAATSVNGGRAQLAGGQIKPSAPSGPPKGPAASAIILSGHLGRLEGRRNAACTLPAP